MVLARGVLCFRGQARLLVWVVTVRRLARVLEQLDGVMEVL